MSKTIRPKWRSINSLVFSIIIFSIYFIAIGKILQELGVPLTTYLASASVIGLAVAFGSQGIVQDVVTGITLVFSDLFDIGELIEIGGQTGYVETIGMRFTIIKNANNAQVFIPNRTITNVINYSKGYVNYFVDIKHSMDEQAFVKAIEQIEIMVKNIQKQYPAIFLSKAVIKKQLKTASGEYYTRIIFRIWPGRNAIIDTSFKQELLKKLQIIDPNYAEWMITNSYEIE
ncbi:mechanosensitive ion channel family protein [Bacteroidota bacterium]